MEEAVQHKEILFRFHSDIFDKEIEEVLWAMEVTDAEDLYRIDSLPFYVPLVATNDIVRAVYQPDEKHLLYQETVSASGNSTIHVVVTDGSTAIADIRDKFIPFGCVSEMLNEHYFAMEIPATADYSQIKEVLDELEEKEIIEYAEPSLSEMHRDQTSF
ncbi:DUF4265 domain-containing protein [Pontibacter qinzhouensis]|uniref:DUF4265 domain-containing protein n=1 Tax=Pontibacter qinzhouensis TaxID=2603253 RepID=A0A5C8KER9_9BACT|nr:DUF4265 domain-containing protein [Pontibacter qinzhouensis]TXK51348.1 DUF4265 domain-containing protein [Pontibacter qinzhouensis]